MHIGQQRPLLGRYHSYFKPTGTLVIVVVGAVAVVVVGGGGAVVVGGGVGSGCQIQFIQTPASGQRRR